MTTDFFFFSVAPFFIRRALCLSLKINLKRRHCPRLKGFDGQRRAIFDSFMTEVPII